MVGREIEEGNQLLLILSGNSRDVNNERTNGWEEAPAAELRRK